MRGLRSDRSRGAVLLRCRGRGVGPERGPWQRSPSHARATRFLVLKARDTFGGGTCSRALTLPGFLHDNCSAVHPLGVLSPALRTMPLEHRPRVDPPTRLRRPTPCRMGARRCWSRRPSQQATAWGRTAEAGLRSSLLACASRNRDRGSAGAAAAARKAAADGAHRIARAPLGGLARARLAGEEARALFGGCALHAILPTPAASDGGPFLIVCQQSLFDDTRAPLGRHTGYGYCHVQPAAPST